jgi:acyl-CoA thioesterase-2
MTVEIESAWPRYPDYRIDVEPCPFRGQVWVGEVLVAESDRCLLLRETDHVDRLYVPVDDVRWEHFEPSAAHTVCPFKGQADYWHCTVTDPAETNVVWAYPTPFPEVAGIAGHVCFYHERVRVVLVETWPDGSEVPSAFPSWGDAAELLRLIDLEPAGDGRFTAPAYGDTERDVVEGGQLLADAIVAASKAVPGQRVTSASMIFSKAASFTAPLDVDVDVLRGGRTFSTVEVRVSQHGSLRGAALLLTDAGVPDLIHHAVPMPDVPGPEEAELHDFRVTGREIRVVGGMYSGDPDKLGAPELHVWTRFRRAPAQAYLHQALLAQSTTHWTIAAAMLPHPGYGEAAAHVTLSTGIMQTTVAFHDEVDVTEWLLYSNPAIWAGRGLCQGEGRVHTRDGRLVASYSVQAMVRGFAGDADRLGGFKSAM